MTAPSVSTFLNQAGNLAVQRALMVRGDGESTAAGGPGAAARIHQGSAVEHALDILEAPGAAVGRDILLSRCLSGRQRAAVLGHELRHVAQLGGLETDPCIPLRLGARGDRWEREAANLVPLSTAGADPQVVRRYDPDELSSQLPGVCEPETWDSGPNMSIDSADDTASVCSDPDMSSDAAGIDSGGGVCEEEVDYVVDPTQINARSLSNRDLILQGIETRETILSFRETSPETEAWAQLDREIEDERAHRVNAGFVFMATARDALPDNLLELRSGAVEGTTGVYVADTNMALDAVEAVSGEIYMTGAQLQAYIESAGMMEIGGEQAERAMQILSSGDTEQFAREFQAASRTGPGPQLSLSRMRRSSYASDLVSYGSQPWLLPIDAQGSRAMGLMGEASYWMGPETGFGRHGIALNDPAYTWTNVLGQTQSGNSPIADFLIGGRQVIPGPYQGIPVSSAATGQLDQERATRFLMQKMAQMLDVPGRTSAGTAPVTPTTDMAEAHIRQMAQDAGLNLGSSEFAAAQQQFLSDTLFSVPRERLADIRDAVRQPFTARDDGGRRPALLSGYQALYDSVLRDSPIEATLRNGDAVQIGSFADLTAVLPNSLVPGSVSEGRPGGPGQASLDPSVRARVFDLLGRMAESRIIATEDVPEMIASSDLLRGVGQPGVGEHPTRVLSMDIADFSATGQRIRQGLSDSRTVDPGAYRWQTAETQTQADAYLSFLRMLAGNADLSRGDPEFAALRAAVTQEIMLTMPADQRAPLMEAILTSDSALAGDIRAALAADSPTIDLDADLPQLLLDRTTTIDLTTPELQGTRRYATDLHARYGAEAPSHLSADALTLYQQPGLSGVGRRMPGSIGQNLWANVLGYGVTAALDSASGRDVQLPSFEQGAVDLAIGVGSEELERQMAARLFSRVPITSALGRSVFQRAAPGFIIQPVISLGMGEYSMAQDRDYYAEMGITMSDEEVWSRRRHALGVGVTGAAASAGALYVIGSFTAGGSAAGPPGALAGFLIGAGVVAVGALASWVADRSLSGSREEWLEEHRRVLEERQRQERERMRQIRAGEIPVQTFDGDRIPIPFRPSRTMSAEEQRVIAAWFMNTALYGQCEDVDMSLGPPQ